MRARQVVAAAAVAVAIALIWWWRGAEHAGTRVAPVQPAAPAQATPRSRPQLAPIAGKPAGISADDPLTFYRKANVYPPTSRPLTPDMLDLLQPDRCHEQPLPADDDEAVRYLFTADRYFVLGDDTITATLDVRRAGKPIAVSISQAFVTVLDPVNHVELPIPIAFDPHGTVYQPARLAVARQVGVGMYVEFSYGTGRQRAHLDFQYTPTTAIPARFTGAFREAIENGSLAIYAGVDVTTAGDYLIDANLFDVADHPIGWTRFKAPLAEGAQEAALVFFGKVIVDAGFAGPYHLGQLRGARYDPTRDPDLEQMPPYVGAYTTRAYPVTAFSSAEWDSPDKQRMLQFLAAQQQQGILQGGAAPAPAGTAGSPGK